MSGGWYNLPALHSLFLAVVDVHILFCHGNAEDLSRMVDDDLSEALNVKGVAFEEYHHVG